MNKLQSTIIHISSVEAFDRIIDKAQHPVVVDFWAPWCGPCKMMEPILEEFAADHDGRAIVAKVNVDEVPALAQRFEIRSIPTIVFFNSGEEVARHSGVANKAVLVEHLKAS